MKLNLVVNGTDLTLTGPADLLSATIITVDNGADSIHVGLPSHYTQPDETIEVWDVPEAAPSPVATIKRGHCGSSDSSDTSDASDTSDTLDTSYTFYGHKFTSRDEHDTLPSPEYLEWLKTRNSEFEVTQIWVHSHDKTDLVQTFATWEEAYAVARWTRAQYEAGIFSALDFSQVTVYATGDPGQLLYHVNI